MIDGLAFAALNIQQRVKLGILAAAEQVNIPADAVFLGFNPFFFQIVLYIFQQNAVEHIPFIVGIGLPHKIIGYV